jgi:hypothetical protein
MDRLLTKADLAEILGVGIDVVHKKITGREWPFTWVGRKVRFTNAQAEQIIALGEQPALAGPLAAPVLRMVTGPRPPAGPSTPPPPSGPATPSKRGRVA